MTDNDPRPSIAEGRRLYEAWQAARAEYALDYNKAGLLEVTSDNWRDWRDTHAPALLAVAEAAREIRTGHPGSCCCVFHEANARFRP